MAFNTTEQSGLVVSTTELSLISGTSTLQTVTDDAVVMVFIDLNDMLDADILLFKLYETVRASGTKRVMDALRISHAPGTAKGFIYPSVVLLHGWDFTIQRVGGTDVTIDSSVRKIS